MPILGRHSSDELIRYIEAAGESANIDGKRTLSHDERVNFGFRQVGIFNRAGFVEHVCGTCHRSVRDETVDLKAWMAVNLDAEVLPAFEMMWG